MSLSVTSRRALSWSHLWLGLVGGLVFTLLAVSGALTTFRPQLALWLGPSRAAVSSCTATDWDTAQAAIEAAAASTIDRLYAPPPGDVRYHLRMRTATDAIYTHVIYDACANQVLGLSPLQWMDWLVDFHHNFLAGRTGRLAVGVAGAGLFLSGLGGVLLLILARPRVRRLLDIRLTGSARRAMFDVHRLVGAVSAVLLLVQTFTGLWLCFPQPLRAALAWVAPVALEQRPAGVRSEGPTAGLGAIMAAAARALPDGEVREIRMPGGYGNVQVRMWRRGDFRSLGNNVVSLDRITAGPRQIDRYDGKPAGNRFIEAMPALHYAEWGGLTYRAIYGLSGFASLPLFLTGCAYWWLRTSSAAAAPRRPLSGDTVSPRQPSVQPSVEPRMTRTLLSVLLVLACLTTPALAQVDRATVTGTIHDASGALVEGASVTVTHAATGLVRPSQSNTRGVFFLTGLPLGRVKLDVALAGFRPVQVDTDLVVGETRTVDFTLEVASVESAVEVVAPAALVRNSAGVGSVLENAQVSKLPINGRNWGNLMALVPGAVDTGGGNGSSVRFLGHGGDDNNFRVDGVDATSVRNQSQSKSRLLLSTDAISEFRVTAALYSAESGGSNGGQVEIVTKGGSNEWTGGLFEYFRNSALDARSPFDGATVPQFHLNQFGGTFGGRIRKDRTFFFGSYEGLRQKQGRTKIGFVPSAAFRAASVPAVQAILAAYPEGQTAVNANVMQWTGVDYATQDEDVAMVRVDHRLTDRVSGYLRFSKNRTDIFTPSATLPGGTYNPDAPTSGVLDFLFLLSNRSTNELRLGTNYSEPLNSRTAGGTSDIAISVPSFSTLPAQTFRVAIGRSLSLVDQFATFHGNHTVKAGVDLRHVQLEIHDGPNAQAGTLSYASLADFQINRLNTAEYSAELPRKTMRKLSYFLYAQDEWKPAASVTANLGVRYEYYGVFREIHGRAIPFDIKNCGGYCAPGSTFSYPDRNNIAPRLSVSWAPGNGRTVFSAGTGLYYGDAQLGDQYNPANNDTQRFTLSQVTTPGLGYPIDSYLSATTGVATAPRAMPLDKQNERSFQWGLSVQRAMGRYLSFVAGYTGQRNDHVFSRTYVNLIDPATKARPLPALDQIDVRGSDANSRFKGLTTTAKLTRWHGLSATVNYMWSHATDDGSSGGGGATYAQNVACRSCEWADSAIDARHVFSSYFDYTLPWAADRWFGGWQLTGIATARTGMPLNVTVTRRAADLLDGNSLSPQRPDVVPGVPMYLDYGATGKWLNLAAFAVPAPGTWGNLPRNAVRGPGLFQVDSALSKHLRLSSRTGIDVGVQIFNLFNRPQLGAPVTNISSATFGRITTLANSSPVGAGTPRQAQLMMRLTF